MTDLSIHDCTGITVQTHSPSNANCVRVRIDATVMDFETGKAVPAPISLTLFDLPEHVTDKLLEAFGPAENTIPRHAEEAA